VAPESTPRAARPDGGLRWTRRRLLWAIFPFIVLAATYAVATIDIRNHDGRVLRGVMLGDIDVGGMTAEELDAEFDRINVAVETANVYIETPSAAYQIDAGGLGMKLDRNATRAAVLAAGRGGTSAVRPFGWVKSLFSQREVDPIVVLDPLAAEAGLRATSIEISVPPGEPTLLLDTTGRLVLEPGTAGSILDVQQLRADLGRSIPSEPGQDIFVDGVTTTESSIDVDIQALVDKVNVFTVGGVEFIVNGASITAQAAEFRSWVRLDLTGAQPQAEIDTEIMYRWINAAAGISQGDIDTRALLVDGADIRLPASNAIRCCLPTVGDEVMAQVLADVSTIELDLIEDDFAPLQELGVGDLLGEFTTEHPAGEDRVINIQRMADIVRGAVIEPGDTFSLNGYVGERTEGRGFVPAGVIYNGVFAEDVGGGVSQFATTLFNASFFAGLDFVQYQPHSIYIDRYPFGREATVSWPNVDLQIRNPNDAPVLIWTEFTGDSITVKLFGTLTSTSEQTDQTTTALNECTRVRTERTITYLDGRVEVDSVGATYQPSEGRDCDGKSTVPFPECEEFEGLVDPDGDGLAPSCVPLDVICPAGSSAIDENGDEIIDYCSAEECPENTAAIDTDDDGVFDECVPRQAEPTESDEPVDEEAGSAEPAVEEPVAVEPVAEEPLQAEEESGAAEEQSDG